MHIKDFLLESQRLTGTRKPVTIINPDRYEEFFDFLKTLEIPDNIKVFLAISISGGLRVSECLGLRVSDFDLTKGYGKFEVLKKKPFVKNKKGDEIPANPVIRLIKLHPIAIELLTQHIKDNDIKHFGYILNFSRQYAFKKIKDIFGKGACPHSIARHSHITWLLRTKSPLTVSRIIEISPRVVESYNHIDTKKELEKIYG